jgi:hypothetical protein
MGRVREKKRWRKEEKWREKRKKKRSAPLQLCSASATNALILRPVQDPTCGKSSNTLMAVQCFQSKHWWR